MDIDGIMEAVRPTRQSGALVLKEALIWALRAITICLHCAATGGKPAAQAQEAAVSGQGEATVDYWLVLLKTECR